MNPEIEANLRRSVNFPSPPGVATHIIELAQDPDIEMGKVATALSMDSALSTKILRIANSPLYAQRRKSENLRQALVVLGLNATLTLALSFSLVKSLRGGKSNGLSYGLYWRRALLAAVDHAYVGGWLMQGWNLPERLHRAISHSHQLDLSASADAAQIFDRCVALSGTVADLFLLDPEQRQFAEVALCAERSLGLYKMAFGQVLGTIGAMIPETEAIFETDLLARQHPELILEQARDVLMLRSLHALREINTLRTATEGSLSHALEVEEETRRDPLTGVYNRAYLDQFLGREFENSAPLTELRLLSTTSPNSSRLPIKLCTRPRCAAATAPCPSIGNYRALSPVSAENGPFGPIRGRADKLHRSPYVFIDLSCVTVLRGRELFSVAFWEHTCDGGIKKIQQDY